MKFISAGNAATKWDAVIIGSGFGSMFFLRKLLEKRPQSRILVLERGRLNTPEWQVENKANSDIDPLSTFVSESDKEWNFTIGLGGGTNCWWGLTPRMHPADFDIRTQTGASADWPLRYDDLVPYYQEAERIMAIAGPDDLDMHYPGASPYPQRPHHMSTVDRMMKAASPDLHFAVPCARLTEPIGERARCCGSNNCGMCPVGAKFSALNGMTDVLSDDRVRICIGSEATFISVEGGLAREVVFRSGNADYSAYGDLVVLGANAIHSPFILLRSGIGGDAVGRYLGEKMLANVEVLLDGLDHFDGGTATTAINLSALLTPRTADRGAAVYYFDNMFNQFGLRLEPGRWRQVLPLSIVVEDLFDKDNRVMDKGGDKPYIAFRGFSEYAWRGLDTAMAALPEILRPLPVSKIRFRQLWPTNGHVQGTLRMGASPSDSVVDRDLICHGVRNLAIVGTSVFPTSGSVNPSLTAAALSLRAAAKLAA